MRSGLMEILRKRTFDFAGLQAGTSETVVEGDADLSEYGDATIAVRVHDNATTGTSSIVVAVHSRSYSSDDPDTPFVASTPSASVTIDAGTADGVLLVAGVLEGFGGCLELRVTGTRNGSDTCRAEISVELVRRRGVAAPRRSLADTLVVGNTTGGTDLVVTSGDELRPSADNTTDVGTAAQRFRTLYAGTSVLINTHPAAKILEAMQISTLRI